MGPSFSPTTAHPSSSVSGFCITVSYILIRISRSELTCGISAQPTTGSPTTSPTFMPTLSPEMTSAGFGASWSDIGLPGDAESSFQIKYTDPYKQVTLRNKCISSDMNGDLNIDQDCSGNEDQMYTYTAAKKLVVQGGDWRGRCMYADGEKPKLHICGGPGISWSDPGQPGSGSTFSIAYADSYNTESFGGKCVGWDEYLDLEIFFDCSSNSVPRFIYTSDKKIQVQGGDKNGWCVWADRGTYPKLSDCNDSNKLADMIWTYEGGQLRTRGGTKCLVTWHGTESSHTLSLTAPGLTMRNCASLATTTMISNSIWSYINGNLMTRGLTQCLIVVEDSEGGTDLKVGDCPPTPSPSRSPSKLLRVLCCTPVLNFVG
ncbi:hypothetical protein THAOC_22239 [Thalassiosira oceanica]|uniref:Uncharacterized protein n=1 Tax=Thalassiosira oceanica TaxID=159749 RepID=K0RV83_THAOC|nr:hypothetical protein THAOC_22239 [Thalassiosira oceanica]|eukprot:EJK57688.1 hypothetical protein THAOC_22239 [Thalassiosira oceanica]